MKRVTVIGAGTMGHGIAYVAALAGCEVRLTDAKPEALPRAIEKITQAESELIERTRTLRPSRTCSTTSPTTFRDSSATH